MKKGTVIIFKDREKTVIKGSSNPVTGMIITDKQTYSLDFLNRWLSFGFIKIK